uniref:3'-5' exonuclease domain-containing protein n=1 Tax=Leptobrachium leishanense TaxID=445787 RepID=A0A8C5LW50_9ANUR
MEHRAQPHPGPCTAAEEAMDLWYAEGVDLRENFGSWKRIVGKTVKLVTRHGEYQGIVISIDAGRAVSLNKVELLRDTEEDTPAASVRTAPAKRLSEDSEEHGLNERVLPNDRHLEADSATMQALCKAAEEVCMQYTVIDKLQPMFGPAIRHMQSQCVLSISAAGYNVCHRGLLCWLQMATKSDVYLFDIFTMGPKMFKNGLKMVLEDSSILKVIHDCRGLSDCLSQQYGIVLSNVFDSQVADVFLFYMATGGFLPHQSRALVECLSCHLDIEPSQTALLNTKETLIKEHPGIWMSRPLPVSCLKLLALEVVHLSPLRLVMLDAMMADFTHSVERCLNSHQHRTWAVQNRNVFSGSDLPEELLQLSIQHESRRKKAMETFTVNERGLLVPCGEKTETKEQKYNAKPELRLPFCDRPFPSSKDTLTRSEEVLKPPEKTDRSLTSPKPEEELGRNVNGCYYPVEPSGTTAVTELPVQTLQNTSSCEKYEPPIHGLRNLGLTETQSASRYLQPVIPFCRPAGTMQLRMCAPQSLVRNLCRYSS